MSTKERSQDQSYRSAITDLPTQLSCNLRTIFGTSVHRLYRRHYKISTQETGKVTSLYCQSFGWQRSNGIITGGWQQRQKEDLLLTRFLTTFLRSGYIILRCNFTIFLMKYFISLYFALFH